MPAVVLCMGRSRLYIRQTAGERAAFRWYKAPWQVEVVFTAFVGFAQGIRRCVREEECNDCQGRQGWWRKIRISSQHTHGRSSVQARRVPSRNKDGCGGNLPACLQLCTATAIGSQRQQLG